MNLFTTISRASLALLLLASLPVVAQAGPVTLKDLGPRVVLSNGTVTATLNKDGAAINSLQYKGFEMLQDGYYSMDGGANYRRPGHCEYKVVQQTPEIVDVAMTSFWKDEPQAFDIEIHYVLRAADSGLYTYAVLRHPANYPKTGYGEWRMVWKLNNDLLEYICVDEKRFLKMQSSKDAYEPQGIKEIIKITSGHRAGQYDCKYDYSASYYDLGCWGHASQVNKIGAFIVMGSQEFLNDGPTKQDLNAAAGINHIHFGMNHYNSVGAKADAGETWSKMYGPFLLYCNSGESPKAIWDDAKAQTVKERSLWPYAWVENADWVKPADRATVTGKLTITDPLKPTLTADNAWVGLAAPAPGGNWQFESQRYQFWTRAGNDGSFTIPHVRPGEYKLYAFTNGAVGEYEQANVTVKQGEKLALGNVTWTVPHKGKTIAWEIGYPDRTAAEWRGGDDYFHGYVWQNFVNILSNPLEYTIGKSDPKKPLNFAQCRYGDTGKPNVWNINFDLPTTPTADATLTAAIASADRGRAEVLVNGTSVGTINPKVQGGNALLRESIHAKYCVEYVTIPATALKVGSNTISLVFPAANTPQAHIMYDYLNLEMP